MLRLDALRCDRIGGLLLLRDEIDSEQGHAAPWHTAKGDLTHMRQEVKRIIPATCATS